MRLQDDLDFTTLNWVKQELDETLKQARQALEAYVEDPADSSLMRFCATYLHQVQGTLRMVELYGAAMVVEEMERVAQALLDNQIRQKDDSYGVLMRGIVQLPDYLERLQGGHKDIPIVLLPLLNDLRSCRGEKLLSESVLFSPDLTLPLPKSAQGPDRPLPESETKALAGRLRTNFQTGLLNWIRDKNAEEAIGGLVGTLERLRGMTQQEDARRLWWVAAGVLEGLLNKGLDPNATTKLLFGKVDREIKRLADSGEQAFRAEPPRELTKNLLYYVAHSRPVTDRIRDVKATYHLDTLVPSQSELEHAKGSLAGKNRALLDTVSTAIKEDLMRVKDALDLYLRTTDAKPEDLGPQAEQLDRVADTLGMLGLGVPRRVVQDQRKALADISGGMRKADETSLLDIAGALLYVEASLDENIQTLGGGEGAAAAQQAKLAPEGEKQELDLPQTEVKRILDAVMKEAQQNLQTAKSDIVAFVESPWDHDKVTQIPRLLEEIAGALKMLNLDEAVELVQALVRFIEVELLRMKRVPTAEQMDRLADALASVEYYVEATRDQRTGREKILDVTRRSLEALGYWPVPPEEELAARGEAAAAAPAAPKTVPHIITQVMAAPKPADLAKAAPPAPEAPKPAPTFDSVSFDTTTVSGAAAFKQADTGGPSELTGVEMPVGDVDEYIKRMERGETAAPAAPAAPAKVEAPQPELKTVVEIAPGKDLTDLVLGDRAAAATSPPPPASDVTGLRFAETVAPELARVESEDDFEWVEIEEEVEVEAPANTASDASFQAVQSDDIDDEIREVFVEEVQEEIDNINRQLPVWSRNVSDLELLKPVRRSFHTLKGSGRLVGALALGEFAWKVENMLNRVLDKTITAGPPVMGLLEHAVGALPQLLSALRGEGAPTVDVHGIMGVADQLAAGEEAWVKGPEKIKVKQIKRIKVPKARPAAPIEPPVELTQTFDITTPLEEPAPVAEVASPVVIHTGPVMPEIEPTLREILKSELEGHLATIHEYLDASRATAVPQPATEALLRAVHTMHGAISMVEVPVLSEVVGPLEGYLKRLRANTESPDKRGFAAIAQAAEVVEQVLAVLDRPGAPLPAADDLISEVAALRDRLPEPESAMAAYSIQMDEDEEELAVEAPVVEAPVAAEPSPVAEEAAAELAAAELVAEEEIPPTEEVPVFEPELFVHSTIELEPAPVAESLELPPIELDVPVAAASEFESAPPIAEPATSAAETGWNLDEIERALAEEAGAEAAPAAAFEDVAAEEPAAAPLAASAAETDDFAIQESVAPSEPAAFEEELFAALEQEPIPAPPPVTPVEASGFEDIFAQIDEGAEAEPEPALPEAVLPEEPAPLSVEHAFETFEALEEPAAESARADAEAEAALAAASSIVEERFEVVEPAAPETVEAVSAAPAEDYSFDVLDVADEAPAAPAPLVAMPLPVAAAPVAVADDPDPSGPLELPEMDEDLIEIFVEEGVEILDKSDALVARLRDAPKDRDAITGLQRHLHTLKGNARAVGLGGIGDLAHAMESLLEHAIEGQVDIGSVAVSSLERGYDRLHRQVSRVAKRQAVGTPVNMIERFEKLAAGETIELEAAAPAPAPAEAPAPVVEAPIAEAFAPEAPVIEAFAEAPAEAPAAPEVEAPRVEAPAPTPAPAPVAEAPKPRPAPPRPLPEPAEEDVARPQQEMIRVRSDLLDALVNFAGEVSIYRSRLEQQMGNYRFNLVELDQTVQRLREQLRKLEIETEAQIIARYQREHETADAEFDPLELDRFSTLQQLSRALAESVSDLVSLQNALEDLTRGAETLLLQQSRVSSDLQEGLMRTRMVPFDSIVPFLRRLLRQTADELTKKATLKVEGAQGEMDRNLLERMKAPFEHMLRNAVAHGIETPADRSGAGKDPEGHVRIAVSREATEVVIRVSDDGRGMDRDAIKRKAIERGLMRPDAQLSDRDLFGFVLETGFSTVEQVTKIAGRGVGMDVVASEIRQLGGSLAIDSTRGKGTTFTIRLPFTLAVTQAILVRLGDSTMAVPMSSVQGVARIGRDDLAKRLMQPHPIFTYAGEEYHIYELDSLLALALHRAADDAMVPLLLTRSGDQRAAIRVDAVMGSREVVVKSVGPQLASVPGIFGATIMGDGSVVMILDVAPLVRRAAALREEVRREAELEAAMPGLLGEEKVEAPIPPAPVAVVEKRQPLVMVVDDSITMRKVTTRVLERNDMEVVTAKDGLDAVEKLQDRVPDLMLLDIEMPRMDGYELATYMRNDSRLKTVPIIMITSRTGEKHRQRAFEIGVDRYLGKPYQEADLLRNVEETLRLTRAVE